MHSPAMAMPSPAAPAGLNTGQAAAAGMQVAGPRVSLASSGSRSMLLAGMDGDLVSWDDFDSPTGAAADTLLSGSAVWAMSPLSVAADSEGAAEGVTLQHLIQQASNAKRSQQIASAMACQPLPACPASGRVPWSNAGPATPNSMGCSLGSSIHSVPQPAVQLPQAACSIGGFSNSSLAPASAAAGSRAGYSIGRTSFAGEVLMLQDNRYGCPDSQVPMGSSLPSTGLSSSPLYMQTQQLHSSNSSLQWDDPFAGASPNTDPLALISAQLAAVRAGADAAARMVPAHAQHVPIPTAGVSVNMLGGSVDSASTGLLSGGMDGLGISLSLQQQMQLAHSTLGFTGYSTSANGTAQGPGVLMAPCSLGQPLPPAGVPVSAQGGVDGPAAMGADSNASAMTVAQLKLQQLLAVEQIQQQLQNEVMRLLPLI